MISRLQEESISMLYAHFTTSEGKLHRAAVDAETPTTVANFVGLAEGSKEWTDRAPARIAKQATTDGTVFHRVIDEFMIQGGDPLGQGTADPATSLPMSSIPTLRHSKPGILSMANSGPQTPTAVSFSSHSCPRMAR